MSRFAKLTLAIVTSGLLAWVLPEGWRGLAWLVLLLTYLGIISLGVAFPQMRLFIETICILPTSEHVVALTFDDGPDRQTTPLLLDLLTELNVKAGFFCVGRNVEDDQDLTRDIVRHGHFIGNHTHNHHWWWLLGSAGSMRCGIAFAQQAVQRATGQR